MNDIGGRQMPERFEATVFGSRTWIVIDTDRNGLIVTQAVSKPVAIREARRLNNGYEQDQTISFNRENW